MRTAHNAALLFFLCLASQDLSAQQEEDLTRVVSLTSAGRLTEARATLERWQQRNDQNSSIPAETRAQALMLSAQLAVGAEAALAAYRSVALGYPASEHAAEALLRLGQGMVASATASGGDPQDAERAIVYLSRLLSDHPRSPHRAPAVAWLAHARLAAGQRDEACRFAAAQRREVASDPQALVLLRDAEMAACGAPKR